MSSAPISKPGTPPGSLGRSWPVTPAEILLLILLLGGLLLPGTLKYKLDYLGFGVCHQLGTHSFVLDAHQLPLCARCSGIYLGAAVALLLLLVLRPLAAALPAPRVAPLLAFMFATMILDGINSTVQAMPGGSALYETTNLLRLITGMLAGIALMFVLYPVFNQSFWRKQRLARERSIDQAYELFGYLVAAAVVGGILYSYDRDPEAGGFLYWTMSLFSTGGLLSLLVMTNVLVISSITRRPGSTLTWRSAVTPLLLALVLALIELTILTNLRIGLTEVLATSASPSDLPLVPGLP